MRVNTNARKEILGIQPIFDASAKAFFTTYASGANPTNASFTASDRFQYCRVFNKYEGIITVTTNLKAFDDADVVFENLAASKFKIYICDLSNNSIVKPATVAEIFDYKNYGENYTEIFVRMSYGKPRDIIIYK